MDSSHLPEEQARGAEQRAWQRNPARFGAFGGHGTPRGEQGERLTLDGSRRYRITRSRLDCARDTTVFFRSGSLTCVRAVVA